MNRRFLINSIAAVVVVVMLVLVGRAMRYEPARTRVDSPPASSEAVPSEGAGGSAAGSEAGSGAAGEVSETPSSGGDLSAAAALVRHAEIGFRSPERLAEHYQKHGAEFGGISADGYLLLAQALRDRPSGGDVLETVRRDGVVTRFDRASGAFLAFDRDFTIRTFFRPNDGESYFRRQGLRE